MSGITISVKQEDIRDFVSRFTKKNINKAIYRTVNEAGRGATAEATKNVRKNYNVSSKEFKTNFSIKRAKGNTLEYMLKISGHRPNVIRFMSSSSSAFKRGAAVKQRVGVKVKVRRAGGFKEVKQSFVGNSGRTVFMRDKNSRKIRRVTTLSAPQMMQIEGVEIFKEVAAKRVNSRFYHNLLFYMGKK